MNTGQIALELVADADDITRYLSGEVAIPLERQICLAHLVAESIPSLAGHGHNLLGQIRAELAFQLGETKVHRSAPPTRF